MVYTPAFRGYISCYLEPFRLVLKCSIINYRFRPYLSCSGVECIRFDLIKHGNITVFLNTALLDNENRASRHFQWI